MIADRSDGPLRVQGKTTNFFAWSAPLLFGIGVTAGGLYLAAEQMKSAIDARTTPLDAEAFRRHNEQVNTQQSARFQSNGPAINNEKSWIRSSETPQQNTHVQNWPQQQASEPLQRQTSFSDANYVAKGATNVVPATRVPKDSSKVQPKPKKQEVVIVGKPDPKLSDYCPYAEGSIEHRNCKARINLSTRNR